MAKSKQNKDKDNEKNENPGAGAPLLPKHAGESPLRDQIFAVSAAVVAILLTLMLLLTNMRLGWNGSKTGVVGYFICSLLYGLFGSCAYLIPAALVYLALIRRRSVKSGTAKAKLIFTAVFICALSALFYLLLTVGKVKDLPAFYRVTDMWRLSIATADRPVQNRGGVIGALLGGLLYVLLKKIAWIFTLLILVGALLILTEITPASVGRAAVRLAKSIGALIERIKAAHREKAADPDKKRLKEAKELGRKAREHEKESGDAPGEKQRMKLFPDASDDSRKTYKDKPIGISPIKYDEVNPVGSAPDPKLGETLPPVLDEAAAEAERARAAAKKKPEEPYDPNPYVDRPTSSDNKGNDGGDPELMQLLFGGDGVPRSGSGDIAADMNGYVIDRTTGEVTEKPSDPSHPSDSSAHDGETNDEKFEKIANLQSSDENDHALTDPDLADPDELIEKPKHEYRFPPLTLLKKDQGGLNADHSEELKANGIKLVSALESFKVKTKITSISRGPTITRYELLPDQGVRVRAIANLVDDIALNLETSGVRIEAPIPGKPAVGIEVPNRVRETVYLRDLLENPKFGQAGSKVTAALGMDVAGDPIFVDIAKMPHLLIAGTTGSGKSVCINSLITSLLFRATPDEVKLILIDPKKVELGVYNKLPHLLVPVVTNPKKAAGSLTWAVAEMEKRYELIEEAGVRDIKGYNKMVDELGTGEKIPSIIIVIDELADLMMSAPDTVEESICRIAQKARAAGMHLIIGTQRPSVDVITGLIKANIPSRIAFTVRSNIDSRTIIDIAGAEKLIGQGDMLYAPVGAMKPIRVQGAFVSDREVEAVCDYIRDSFGEVEYDQKAIDEIRECEAECEEIDKKKGAFGSADDDDELDPKFMECVHVAVESGKISTSLLQRRMGLGYGRAAKIIDRMTEMGIVSAPDGQKPRNVLISMAQYQEMVMRREDESK